MDYLDKILNFPLLSRVRRNHALEHATLQVLARKKPNLMVAGYSDTRGFLIIGAVSTDQLHDAVNEALRRLRAISPRLEQVVVCRWFAGLSEIETADTLKISERSVRRDWEKARLWLPEVLA